jgi:hypothetical protein
MNPSPVQAAVWSVRVVGRPREEGAMANVLGIDAAWRYVPANHCATVEGVYPYG